MKIPLMYVPILILLLFMRLSNLGKARDSYEFALVLDALSRIATTYVADHDWHTALEYANQVIDKDENNASALATAAICHCLLNNDVIPNRCEKRLRPEENQGNHLHTEKKKQISTAAAPKNGAAASLQFCHALQEKIEYTGIRKKRR